MSEAKFPASMIEVMLDTLPVSSRNSQALEMMLEEKDIAFGEQVQYENLSQELLVIEVENLCICDKNIGYLDAVEADKVDCCDIESSNLPISIIESVVLPISSETTDSLSAVEADKVDCCDIESSNLPISIIESVVLPVSSETTDSLDALDKEKTNYGTALDIFDRKISCLDAVETDDTLIYDHTTDHLIPPEREESDPHFTDEKCLTHQSERHPNFKSLLDGEGIDIGGESTSSRISSHHTTDFGVCDRTNCVPIKRAVRMRSALSHSLPSSSLSYPLRTGISSSLKQTTMTTTTTRPTTGTTRATVTPVTLVTTRSLNSTLNNALGNAKERLERIDKLSVPIADKFIASPQPPKLSTSCPTLSVTEIEALQAEDLSSKLCQERKEITSTAAKVKGKVKEKKHLIYLPLSANKLRVTISADSDDHWCQNHKSACKARTHYRHDICQGGSIQDLNPLIQPEELKKLLFEKDGRCSNESSPQNLLRHFISSFRFDFICLVIDLQMQIIGTYDVSLGKYLPGLDIGFDYFTKKERESDYYLKRTNLIEIDFNKLPDNLFAIVPVFLDDSNVSRKELIDEARIKSKLFQDILFKLDFFCSANPLAPEEIDQLSELYENNDVKKENEVFMMMITMITIMIIITMITIIIT